VFKKLTRIQEQDKFQANEVCAIELEDRQFVGQFLEGVGHGGNPEKRERQELKLLTVVKRRLVRQVIVHPLVDLVENQHLRPRVLQQSHLVVNLKMS
jgi:hypothetical protein